MPAPVIGNITYNVPPDIAMTRAIPLAADPTNPAPPNPIKVIIQENLNVSGDLF